MCKCSCRSGVQPGEVTLGATFSRRTPLTVLVPHQCPSPRPAVSHSVRSRRDDELLGAPARHRSWAVFFVGLGERPRSRFRDLNSRPAVYETAGLITQTELVWAFSAKLFEIGDGGTARYGTLKYGAARFGWQQAGNGLRAVCARCPRQLRRLYAHPRLQSSAIVSAAPRLHGATTRSTSRGFSALPATSVPHRKPRSCRRQSLPE